MTFPAQMRLGSLEAVAALAAFALVSLRSARLPAAASIASRMMRIQLDIAEHGRTRRVAAVLPATVGRSAEADVLILDPEVSRRHALFDAEGNVIFLTDLGSSNGTFLNGKKVTQAIEVRAGDQIDVGTARMTFLNGTPELGQQDE